jgi:hypothetical protein
MGQLSYMCGDTNTRRELEPGEENYWIYYCTNLACRSNGGDYDIGYPDVPGENDSRRESTKIELITFKKAGKYE